MSSLRDRLTRLTGAGTGGKKREEESAAAPDIAGEEAGDTGNSTSASDRIGSAAELFTVESLDEAWSKLDAAMVRTPSGTFIRRRVLYPMDHVHGDIALRDLQEYAQALSAFRGEGTVRAGDLLFFDTETTGLGLGAGNVPFMIGLGFWEEAGFAVEQLFIRNPAEELAMLTYLKPMLARFPYIVSYNGKSFDWPLLLNRFVMNRMKDGIGQPEHLDFLYPSRSLWRNTLPSCRLGKVEESQLGFNRVDDMPGSMAPTLYFLYLAEKRPSDLAPVFIHNEHDIVSLAGLAVLFGRMLAGQIDPSPKGAEELLRLGFWLHKMGKHELSLRTLELLRSRELQAMGQERELDGWVLPLASHYKQLGAWEEAVELWLRAIEAVRQTEKGISPPLEAYVELSMFYEHKRKDYSAALLYAEEAHLWLEARQLRMQAVARRSSRLQERQRKKKWEGLQPGGREPPAPRTGPEAELCKRIDRLKRKLEKEAAVPGPTRTAAAASGGKPERNQRKEHRRKADPSALDDTLTLF